LPVNGPRSVLIKRRIIYGVPAALVVWISSTEAYAEVQFDDDDPTMNEALIAALKESKTEVEHRFGGTLDWRGPEPSGLMTKRTKVVTPKVSIGERADPTQEGLEELAAVARQLLDAVVPHLQETFNTALAIADQECADDGGSIGVEATSTSALA